VPQRPRRPSRRGVCTYIHNGNQHPDLGLLFERRRGVGPRAAIDEIEEHRFAPEIERLCERQPCNPSSLRGGPTTRGRKDNEQIKRLTGVCDVGGFGNDPPIGLAPLSGQPRPEVNVHCKCIGRDGRRVTDDGQGYSRQR
jgi:hypothetical protein